jgi:hypothetical protein
VTTNRPFTRVAWIAFVEQMQEAKTGRKPTYGEAYARAEEMMRIQGQIPRDVIVRMMGNPKIPHSKVKTKQKVYLMRGNACIPAIIKDDTEAIRVRIDGVGKSHMQVTRTVPWKQFGVFKALMWKGRWAGPEGQTYTKDCKWMCMQKQVELHEITPSWIGKQKALQRFKAPTSEEKWKEYGIDVRWGLTWAIKPKYASPRDIVVWLQLQHRTLWVAKNGGCADDKCTARGCNAVENMTHLVDCEVMQKEFWTPILRIMIGLGLQYERSRTFWIAGQIVGEDNERKAVCGETASFLCWAWRCLYAEVIHARMNDKQLNTSGAVWKTVRMAASRVKAHGAKWRKWFNTQRLWRESRRKMFPYQYQKNILIDFDEQAGYVVRRDLHTIFKSIRDGRTG